MAVGEYKTSANHVKTRTGEIHYYATPEETPTRMHELVEWYRAETTKAVMHPIEIAARFHHQFTAIHPFDDGNGRMSRLLMNLMLMQSGYPPTVIQLGERDEYLAALRRADRKEYDDFIALIGGHVVESLSLFIDAAQGKDVSEPTDLRKEIALELLRLKHIEEPLAKSRTLLYELYTGSFTALVNEAINQVLPFCEFFVENSVSFNTLVQKANTQTWNKSEVSITSANFSEHVQKCFAEEYEAGNTDVRIQFKGFRKGRFDTFDLVVTLKIACEPFKYSVQPMPEQSRIPAILHFYQEPLTRDEIKTVGESLARHILDVIRNKTKT